MRSTFSSRRFADSGVPLDRQSRREGRYRPLRSFGGRGALAATIPAWRPGPAGDQHEDDDGNLESGAAGPSSKGSGVALGSDAARATRRAASSLDSDSVVWRAAPGSGVQRTVIYVRTGPRVEDTARQREWQLMTCRAAADSRRLLVVAECVDENAPSTTAAHRPGWQRVVQLIEAREVDLVLTTDFPRITREWEDVAGLLKLARDFDVEFHTVAASDLL